MVGVKRQCMLHHPIQPFSIDILFVFISFYFGVFDFFFFFCDWSGYRNFIGGNRNIWRVTSSFPSFCAVHSAPALWTCLLDFTLFALLMKSKLTHNTRIRFACCLSNSITYEYNSLWTFEILCEFFWTVVWIQCGWLFIEMWAVSVCSMWNCLNCLFLYMPIEDERLLSANMKSYGSVLYDKWCLHLPCQTYPEI